VIEETLQLKDMVTGPAKEMLEGVLKLNEGFKQIRESSEEGGGGLMAMVEGLSSVASGVGMIAGPLLEVGEKVGDVALEMGKMALESVEAKDKLLATFTALGGGPAAGQKTLDMLNGLSDALPQSREQLGDWAKQYMAMGVLNQDALQGQLKATAAAQALMGDTGAQAYTALTKKIQEATLAHTSLKISAGTLAKQLAGTGANLNDVAAKMGMSSAQLAAKLKAGTVDAGKFGAALQGALGDKGGAALDNMSEDMGTLKAKFSENIGKLFEGIDVKPFTEAVKEIAGVFSSTSATGQGMKAGITTVFNKIFVVVGKVIRTVKEFGLDLVILGLKGYIAIKPLVRWIQSMNEQFDLVGKMVTAVKVAFGLMAVTLGVVVAAIVLVVAAVVAVGAAFMTLLGTVEQFVGAAAGALVGWAEQGATIAGNFIDGLIGGITAGVGKAVDAVKNLGSSVMSGIKDTLGIHSPSIEMMKLGGHTATGFAQGISGGMGAVGGAAQNMTSVANDNAVSPTAYQGASGAPGAPGAAGAGGGSSGGGGTVTIMPGAIVINGAGKDVTEITEEALSLVLERVQLAQGA
jgi:hypothetical protein